MPYGCLQFLVGHILVRVLGPRSQTTFGTLMPSLPCTCRNRRECEIGISGAHDRGIKDANALALVFISLLLLREQSLFQLITKGFVRFASVALIAASLFSLPSAQTISAQTAREALGSLSETVQQIEGTYDGTFTLSQVTGEHQISLTFQPSGSEITITYRSALGGSGGGKGTIAGNVITAVPLRSEPTCPGLYTASFQFSGDTVSWTYSGQDCQGPAQGRGIAKKLKFVSPLTSEADELTNKAIALYQAGKYAEAIPLAQQVLAMREKVLGPDHPDVATVLNSFGILYDKEGRYAEAEPAV